MYRPNAKYGRRLTSKSLEVTNKSVINSFKTDTLEINMLVIVVQI